MRNNAKRVLSIALALFMCLGMLTCIVLPVSAATDTTETADPYARITGTSVDDVITPDANVLFVDSTFKSYTDGYTFEYTYGGDGWGNGKKYSLKFGTSAFATWAAAVEFAGDIDPDVMNNIVLVFAPGYVNSTATPADGSDATLNTVTMTLPDATDPTEEELMNLWFLGPQAGKSPASGVKGDATLYNSRSVDTTKEFVFNSTFWVNKNSVFHFDGFAASGSFNIYSYAYTGAADASWDGLYFENMYVALGKSTTTNQLFKVGQSTAATNLRVSKIFFNNVYFDEIGTSYRKSTSNGYLQANVLEFNGCVFNNLSTTADYANSSYRFRWTTAPLAASQCKFLGDYSGKSSFVMKNTTYNNYECTNMVWVRADVFAEYGANASFTVEDCSFINHGSAKGASALFSFDKSTTANYTMALTFRNNYFSINKDMVDAGKMAKVFNICGVSFTGDVTIDGNTIVGPADPALLCDVYQTAKVMDLSGNLFLDYDGNVRPAYVLKSDSLVVASDIYVSDEMAGGVKELFTVQQAANDLLVLYSDVKAVVYADNDSTATLLGNVTILPKDGVEYPTEDMFEYINENVELLGVYDSVDCTTTVEKITKGFGTLYAKAQYKAEGSETTATVLYTITEPAAYRIVDLSSEATEYTFNGTTYTADNATFYSTVAEAVTAATAATDVVLLMPGTYSTAITIAKSAAILGPQTWVSSSDGTQVAANSRNASDDKGEAIITAKFTVTSTAAPYVTIAGVAMNFSAKTTFLSIAPASAATQGLSFVNLEDCYLTGSAEKQLIYIGSRTRGATNTVDTAASGENNVANLQNNLDKSAHADVHFVMDDCYAKQSGNAEMLQACSNYVSITDSTLCHSAAKSFLYGTNIPTSEMGFMPAQAMLRMENNYLYRSGTAPTYEIAYASGYWCAPYDSAAGIKDGLQVIFNNNTYNSDVSDSKTLIRLIGALNGKQYLEFVGNTILTKSSDGTALIDNYGQIGKPTSLTAKVENNIVINRTKPWQFNDATGDYVAADTPGNSVNVDQNYYGDGSGNVKVLSDYATEGGYVKSSWYYIDEAMTTKNTEVMLQSNDYTTYGEFDGHNNATLSFDQGLTVDDLKACDGATLGVVCSDASLNNQVSGELTSGTYYVNIEKNGVGCLTVMTVNVVCKHLNAERDASLRVAGNYTAPTCGTDGAQEYKCPDCDETVAAWTVTVSATGEHAWNDGEVTTAPTCMQEGVLTKTCTNEICMADGQKATATEPIAKKQHTPDYTTVIPYEGQAPTCITAGKGYYACSVCDTPAVDDIAIDPTGNHNYDTTNWVKDETGHWYACTTVGCTAQDGFATHTPSGVIAYEGKEPTCAAAGEGYIECTACGHVIDDSEEISALTDHNFDEAVWLYDANGHWHPCTGCTAQGSFATHTPSDVTAYQGQESTCYQEGKGYIYCTVCTYTIDDDEVIAPTGNHNYDTTNWVKDETGHWYACTTVGCTAQGSFAGHTPSEVTAYQGQEPTCGSTGLGYQYCTQCAYIVDNAVVIPATTQHSFDGDPKSDKDTHWFVCTNNCGATTDPEKHIASEVIAYGDMPATCTTEGMGYNVCTVCGVIHQTNIVVPATGHTSGEWETVLEPSYLNEGVEQCLCAVCGEPTGETRAIAKKAKVDATEVFDDISATAWYCKNGAIDFAYNMGLLTGVDTNTFNPNGVVTRGMFVTVLGRLHGVEITNTTLTKFTDIQKTAYYAGYVKWASDNGIVNGVTEYAFAPNSSITREQMCTMMVRYCDYAGIELKETKAAVTFSDAASISAYAKTAVAACQKAGLVQGKGNGKFDPKGTATRAEVATILMNLYTGHML